MLAATCLVFDYATIWNSQIGAFCAGAVPLGVTRLLFAAGSIGAGAVAFICGRLGAYKTRSGGADWFLAVSALVLVCAQALCAIAALPCLGTFPWGIDHPCFMFRIREFLDVFPHLGSYNPWWNGGVEHFIGVTSGAHAFAFLLLPFLPFGTLEEIYGPALFFWIFIGGPWLAALSMKMLGCRWRTAIVAALLAMPFSRAEFLFFWQSGNVGGLVTCLMAPPVAALGYKLVVLRKGGIRDAVALGVTAWLSCIWPAGFATAGGLSLGALLLWRRWMRPKPFLPLLIACAMAMVLLLPWIWALLFPSRAVVSYVATSGEGVGAWTALVTGLRHFIRRVSEWNPILFPFGVAGLLVARGRGGKVFFGSLFAVLAAISISIGFLPTSQLDRVALQFAAAATVPAALAVTRLLSAALPRSASCAFALSIAKGATACVLLLSPFVAVKHAGNSAGFKLWPAEDVVLDFAGWIRENVPETGRIAFADLTDCKYDWGKIAYLPVLSGRQMMADDYYGFPHGLTARRFPPRAYRSSEEAYVDFTRIYGITHWSVADDRNRRFFNNSSHFSHCTNFTMQSSSIDVYRFLDQPDPTPFIEGGGVFLGAIPNRIAVRAGGRGQMVLRYNWRRGLTCDGCATIKPVKIDDNITFIGVDAEGPGEVVISYRPGWRKLAPNFDGTFHH